MSDEDLYWAGRRGDVDQVRALLQKGARVDGYRNDSVGYTALHQAAGLGHTEVLKELIDSGAEIDSKSHYDTTPLLLAAELGELETIRALLAAGANINHKNDWGDSALSWSASRGYTPIVKELIDSGAEIDSKKSDGETPLQLAARSGSLETVRLLLAAGANIHHKDFRGRTALWHAALNGRTRVVKELIDRRADIESKDNDGETPLLLAACAGQLETVRVLLAAGANKFHTDRYGRTAMIGAALNGQWETSIYLGLLWYIFAFFLSVCGIVFFFLTKSPKSFSCSRFNSVSQQECIALTALYNSTGGTSWKRQTNWLQLGTFHNQIHPCKWEGITCRHRQVTEIRLPINKLNGNIPPEISNLFRLRVLDLHGNSLYGRHCVSVQSQRKSSRVEQSLTVNKRNPFKVL